MSYEDGRMMHAAEHLSRESLDDIPWSVDRIRSNRLEEGRCRFAADRGNFAARAALAELRLEKDERR